MSWSEAKVDSDSDTDRKSQVKLQAPRLGRRDFWVIMILMPREWTYHPGLSMQTRSGGGFIFKFPAPGRVRVVQHWQLATWMRLYGP